MAAFSAKSCEERCMIHATWLVGVKLMPLFWIVNLSAWEWCRVIFHLTRTELASHLCHRAGFKLFSLSTFRIKFPSNTKLAKAFHRAREIKTSNPNPQNQWKNILPLGIRNFVPSNTSKHPQIWYENCSQKSFHIFCVLDFFTFQWESSRKAFPQIKRLAYINKFFDGSCTKRVSRPEKCEHNKKTAKIYFAFGFHWENIYVSVFINKIYHGTSFTRYVAACRFPKSPSLRWKTKRRTMKSLQKPRQGRRFRDFLLPIIETGVDFVGCRGGVYKNVTFYRRTAKTFFPSQLLDYWF